MKEQLIGLIPEFNLISDENLREKALAVWEKAMKQGNWTINDLTRIPFTLLIPDVNINFLEHTRGVTGICIHAEKVLKEIYGNKSKINRDYLITGAILHDVGKLVEIEEVNGKFQKSVAGKSLRHPFSGVGLCYDEGIPHEIMHIIACHSKEGDFGKRTPEAAILHHADFSNFDIFL